MNSSILQLTTDLDLFIGRLHPIIVHLPIGFLLLGSLFYFLGKTKKYSGLQKALPITLFLGAISAIMAAFIGWLLAKSGGYGEEALFWHKWLGISVAIIAVFAWLLSINKVRVSSKITTAIMAIIIALLSITGHLGGNLTHGEDYLFTYAPEIHQEKLWVQQKQSRGYNGFSFET